MGYIRHHAIIVTASGYNLAHACLNDARKRAVEIFGEAFVTGIIPSNINCNLSFFVGPDGSKEGWEDSALGDTRRDAFIQWLDTQRYGDGSSPLSWAEVQYGDDNREAIVTRHDDEKWREVAGVLE